MEAVKAAGVPKELQATALELAVADLRAGRVPGKKAVAEKPTPVPSSNRSSKAAKKPSSGRANTEAATAPSVLSRISDESTFFKGIENETRVPSSDLADIFHIDGGNVELKVPSRSLGANKRAQTQTLTALIAGAVFGGTKERKLPFGDIKAVCVAKNCFDSANSASSIKATPGFSTVGSGRAQSVVTRSGWQDEFARAARRVLGRAEPTA